jgi:hypothetical protein
MSTERLTLDVWQVDLEFERVKYATEKHAELRGSLESKLKARDEWNKKVIAMRDHAAGDNANEDLLKLRGQAAKNESKRIMAETRAYQVTLKRSRALDQEVFQLLKTIRELEDDPTLKLDPSKKLNAAMRDATYADDPGMLKECLDSLHNPHLLKREAEKMMHARGEIAIMDLKEKIKACGESKSGKTKGKASPHTPLSLSYCSARM